jgi:hypothetical protein
MRIKHSATQCSRCLGCRSTSLNNNCKSSGEIDCHLSLPGHRRMMRSHSFSVCRSEQLKALASLQEQVASFLSPSHAQQHINARFCRLGPAWPCFAACNKYPKRCIQAQQPLTNACCSHRLSARRSPRLRAEAARHPFRDGRHPHAGAAPHTTRLFFPLFSVSQLARQRDASASKLNLSCRWNPSKRTRSRSKPLSRCAAVDAIGSCL